MERVEREGVTGDKGARKEERMRERECVGGAMRGRGGV